MTVSWIFHRPINNFRCKVDTKIKNLIFHVDGNPCSRPGFELWSVGLLVYKFPFSGVFLLILIMVGQSEAAMVDSIS